MKITNMLYFFMIVSICSMISIIGMEEKSILKYPSEILLEVVRTGNVDQVKDLLINFPNININIQDAEGNTPLILAVLHDNLDMVRVLLDHGANKNIEDQDTGGMNGLDWALYKRNLKLIDLLEPDLLISETSEGWAQYENWARGWSSGVNWQRQDIIELVLLEAARAGNEPKVAELLTGHSDININIQDVYGNTPLIWATKNNCLEIVKMLLYYGADKNIANKHGLKPIDWAIKMHNLNLINLLEPWLLKSKASNRFSLMFLEAARVGNEPKVTELLTDHSDININIQDVYGNTPLIWATKNNCLAIVKILLYYGADKNITNKHRLKAIDIALGYDFQEIIGLLSL